MVVSYDVICQWGVHFWERMKKMKDELQLKMPEANITLLIPKFHLPAHKSGCQTYYSFNFATGVGSTHGETIEENWADSNKAAAQTKEMGPGSRQDTLDDIYGFHNWVMMIGLERVLKNRLVVGVKALELHRGLFDKFNLSLKENLGVETMEGWETEVKEWEGDHSKPCPYESTVKGERTLKEVQLELGQEELEEMSRGGGVVQDSSVCVFVVMGLEIEESQCVSLLIHLCLISLTGWKLQTIFGGPPQGGEARHGNTRTRHPENSDIPLPPYSEVSEPPTSLHAATERTPLPHPSRAS